MLNIIFACFINRLLSSPSSFVFLFIHPFIRLSIHTSMHPSPSAPILHARVAGLSRRASHQGQGQGGGGQSQGRGGRGRTPRSRGRENRRRQCTESGARTRTRQPRILPKGVCQLARAAAALVFVVGIGVCASVIGDIAAKDTARTSGRGSGTDGGGGCGGQRRDPVRIHSRSCAFFGFIPLPATFARVRALVFLDLLS